MSTSHDPAGFVDALTLTKINESNRGGSEQP